jgi:tRNA A37 methylthiotransferase MiaB
VLKRGQHRSRSLEDIITEIQQIEAQGGKEIVLTGINLASRGANTTRNPSETQFPLLLEAILKQTTLPRIRISSIGPEYANDHFFEVAQDERILPHFHYSIQSFSDAVLQKMRRGYGAEELKTVLKKTRKLNRSQSELISLGADIIVGFPGESESDFLETLEGVKEYGITKLHAFPFSDHHKGEIVPASLYPDQVAQEVKKERENRLLAV